VPLLAGLLCAPLDPIAGAQTFGVSLLAFVAIGRVLGVEVHRDPGPR
jgi:hypothetical protein